jgi:Fis family transcriptional regulator
MTYPLKPHVQQALAAYFASLDDQTPDNVYRMVMHTVEAALLEDVLQRTDGNQLLASKWLGLNRNTVREKLRQHQLLG